MSEKQNAVRAASVHARVTEAVRDALVAKAAELHTTVSQVLGVFLDSCMDDNGIFQCPPTIVSVIEDEAKERTTNPPEQGRGWGVPTVLSAFAEESDVEEAEERNSGVPRVKRRGVPTLLSPE